MSERPDWLTDGFPELRSAPPWVMEEMIDSEPELLEQIATGLDPSAVALMLRGASPVTVTGCGTSEHASMAVAGILRDAGHTATSAEAFELLLDPPTSGCVIGVSHEAGTAATIKAMRAVRVAALPTALITAKGDGEAAAEADAVLATPAVDRSWCHTVGYTSPIAAALALAARPEAGIVRQLTDEGHGSRDRVRDLAAQLAPCRHLVVIGSGADRIAARELALKIEEAAHIPTAARNLETFLHGHLPSCDEQTGLIVIAAEPREVARRSKVADQARRGGERVGMTVVDLPGTASESLPPTAGALLATALPLQWLALELAMARGVNPDLIRREEAPYREAAAMHE